MDALVDLIKRIGIFMIAAQAVIHFAPEQKYGKYMKLIVSIMILLQFLTPVYRIFAVSETDWSGILSEIEIDYPLEEIADEEPAPDALIDSMEKEIKSKLNNEIADENYQVTNVRVSLKTLQEKDENGFRQYELDNVRVVVMFHTALPLDEKENGIEKIQIQKISVETEQTKENGYVENDSGLMTDDLRQRFAQVLGIGEEYMEVSVYGAVEETVK